MAAARRMFFNLLKKKVKIFDVRTIIVVIWLYALTLPFTAYAFKKGTIQAIVMQVKDGDTVVVAPIEGGQFFTCRLYGIDAPETAKKGKPGQAYGDESEKELKSIILGQIVEIEMTGAKTYDREVCLIRKNGKDINLEMVKRGYAWAYRQYLRRPYASEYINTESEARNKRVGLWQQANPQPPWEWRKKQKLRYK